MEASHSSIDHTLYPSFANVNAKLDGVYDSIIYARSGHPLYGTSVYVSNLASLKFSEILMESIYKTIVDSNEKFTKREISLYKSEKNCIIQKICLLTEALNSETRLLEPYPTSSLKKDLHEAAEQHSQLFEFINNYLSDIYKEDFFETKDSHEPNETVLLMKKTISFDSIYPRREILKEVILNSPNLTEREKRKLSRLFSRPFDQANYTQEKLAGIQKEMQLSLMKSSHPGAAILSKEIAETVEKIQKSYEPLEDNWTLLGSSN